MLYTTHFTIENTMQKSQWIPDKLIAQRCFVMTEESVLKLVIYIKCFLSQTNAPWMPTFFRCSMVSMLHQFYLRCLETTLWIG